MFDLLYNVSMKEGNVMSLSKAADRLRKRKKYNTDSKYRQEKIEDRKEYAKTHKKKESKYSKEYYDKNAEYRRDKIKQAKAYQKKKKKK